VLRQQKLEDFLLSTLQTQEVLGFLRRYQQYSFLCRSWSSIEMAPNAWTDP